MKKIGFFINNTNNKKYLDINYHNIKILNSNFDEFYVVDEETEFSLVLEDRTKKLRKKSEYFFAEGNNFKKINFLLNKLEIDDLDSLTVIFDEYIYINSIQDYFKFCDNSNYDLISFTDSSELFYHLQVNILYIKNKSFNLYKKIINDFSSKKQDYNLLYIDFLKELQLKIDNRACYCKIAYIESNEKKNIFLTSSEYYFYLLSRELLPIINVKYLESLVNDFDNKEFVHKKLPLDFDIDIYRSYDDLKTFDDEFLKKHFVEHGQFECRKYKKSELILPKVLYDKLNKIRLIKYFDFPTDFDFYSYRDKNDDLKKLNKLDLKKHWINYGVYEDRKYK